MNVIICKYRLNDILISILMVPTTRTEYNASRL